MCYNITYLEKRAFDYHERYKDVLDKIFDYPREIEFPQYYHVSGFAHPELPLIKQDGIFMSKWGLIPPWIKDLKQALSIRAQTLNAVSETIFEKPSYKMSIFKKRCLLGVNSFFDSRDVETKKYPYLIKVKDENVFSLGCIYSEWTDNSSGEKLNTFSIVTTEANPLMAQVHNLKKRMPLIIPRELEKEWLNPELSQEQIKELMVPYDAGNMTAFTISKEVNSSKAFRNKPEILNPVQYPKLPELVS
jgi:putative SOS response-associated peptidase YedK